MGENKKAKKKFDAKRIILTIVLIISILGVGFGLGYGTYYWTMPEELKTLNFVIKQINDNYAYYDEETGEYIEFTADDYAKAITNGLLDIYSTYYSPSEYLDVVSSSFGNSFGLGIYLKTSDTEAYITDVIGNSPAEKSGLKKGDIVVAVDGAYGKTFVTGHQSFMDALALYGENEEFSLYLKDVEQPIVTYKANFVASYVWYRDSESGFNFVGEGLNIPTITAVTDNISYLPSDTAYIKLNQFNGDAGSQFGEAYGKMIERGKSKLILDLRGNGGGYMNVLEEISSYLIDDNGKDEMLICSAKYKNGNVEKFKTAENNYQPLKIIALADDGTASASECLLGAMISYETLTLDNLVLSKNSETGVAKTYGKGIMQTTYTNAFNHLEAVKLTTAYIFWPNGTTIHGKGITTTSENEIAVSNDLSVDNELLRASSLASV